MNNAFGAEKSFWRHADRAGLTVALTAIVAATIFSLSNNPHKKSKKPESKVPSVQSIIAQADKGGEQGRQLVTEVEKGKKPSHFKGILAVYNGGQAPMVVMNPYVAPAPGVSHPQESGNAINRDYDYFALIAQRDPSTGKISFTPDELLAAGQETNSYTGPVTNNGPYSMITAESLQNPHPVESSTVQAEPLTYWHNPNNFQFTHGDEAAVKLLGSYTYSVVGNQLLVPPPVRTGNNISLQEPVGLLLQAHPAP